VHTVNDGQQRLLAHQSCRELRDVIVSLTVGKFHLERYATGRSSDAHTHTPSGSNTLVDSSLTAHPAVQRST